MPDFTSGPALFLAGASVTLIVALVYFAVIALARLSKRRNTPSPTR